MKFTLFISLLKKYTRRENIRSRTNIEIKILMQNKTSQQNLSCRKNPLQTVIAFIIAAYEYLHILAGTEEKVLGALIFLML